MENLTNLAAANNNDNSKMKKFFIFFLLLLLLLISLGFWFGIINEREAYRNEAVKSIASSWGDVQIFGSPAMSFEKKKDKNATETVNLQLNNYSVNVKISTEIRKKGIFKVPVYVADVLLKGDFINNYGDLSDKEITTSFTVEDSTGFIEEPKFKINGGKQVVSQDTKYLTKIPKTPKVIPFEISYRIRGLNELYADLGGQSNKVKIEGNWADPSFTGNFLPSSRAVTKDNFKAEWSIPKVATTNVSQVNPNSVTKYSYTDGNNRARVGVSLLVPVDNYRMANRALKYSFLFITLTFLSYFIFEITRPSQKRIHPLQYLLLGGAMLIFYLLLVSISEFLPFLAAYVISSFMTISLIGTYTYYVITKRQDVRFTAIISVLLVILYTFLYILLNLQDLALLIGSLGLFLIIALIMYATRNVDWYNEG